MSDDPTMKLPNQDDADKLTTKPTIETILERLSDFRSSIEVRFDNLEVRFDRLEGRFNDMEIRFDRMDSLVHTTRGEVIELRADFRDHRKEWKQYLLRQESKPS